MNNSLLMDRAQNTVRSIAIQRCIINLIDHIESKIVVMDSLRVLYCKITKKTIVKYYRCIITGFQTNTYFQFPQVSM